MRKLVIELQDEQAFNFIDAINIGIESMNDIEGLLSERLNVKNNNVKSFLVVDTPSITEEEFEEGGEDAEELVKLQAAARYLMLMTNQMSDALDFAADEDGDGHGDGGVFQEE